MNFFFITDLVLFIGVFIWVALEFKRCEKVESENIVDNRCSYEAWHTKGTQACNSMAFTFIDDPRGRSGMSAFNVRLNDGSHPTVCSAIVCGFCGKRLQGSEECSLVKIGKVE